MTAFPSPDNSLVLQKLPTFSATSPAHNAKDTAKLFLNTPVKIVPPWYYTSTLGFFCKKELQLQNAVKFPVMFRLGSVAYTNEMEGKGKAILPPDKR